jgi:hypothetical protein
MKNYTDELDKWSKDQTFFVATHIEGAISYLKNKGYNIISRDHIRNTGVNEDWIDKKIKNKDENIDVTIDVIM